MAVLRYCRSPPLLLVLLLLLCATAPLPTRAAFEPSRLQGLYIFRFGRTRCPTTLQLVPSANISVGAGDVSVGGNSCSAGTLRTSISPGATAGLLPRYISGTRGAGAYIVITLETDLTCPTRTFTEGETMSFVSPDESFEVSWTAVFENSNTALGTNGDRYVFQAGDEVMVLSDVCLFSRIDIKEVDTPACFPAQAAVLTEHAGWLPMTSVAVGDRVAVGEGRFERVVGFSHRDRLTVARFVRLRTSRGTVLTASPGHFVYADGRALAARDVRAGMVMMVLGGTDRVVHVSEVYEGGLYNPHTESGDLVVDGFVVSCYTEAVDTAAAHALLVPVRAAAWVGVDLLQLTGVF